ncbi:MAG: Gfo/Idh/MocA family oxidoreductase [Melioribacteraceae bacterium]|nr:Gfo/Idh/MocA family oxidoreductase [Melioribacteraceae bacterium]
MNFKKINLAIIGSGRWGFNHVRTAKSLLEANQITVFDTNKAAEEKIRELNSEIKFTSDISNILSDESINAVIIATPAETHFEIAKKCLESGKNVLVEKPITLHVDEAQKLYDLSVNNNLKLMVGHVLLYHPAVLKIKEEMESGKIGKLQYIYSNRLNLGAIRSEENILWSFAPHDISIMQFFTDSYPTDITAKGEDFIQNGIEDTTLTYLEYPTGVRGHIFVSWLHPFKEQRLVVIGEKGMYVFEDSLKTDKLKFYDKGFKKVDGEFQKFDNDFESIEFEAKMPLGEEHLHFYNSILNNTTPRTDGKHALEVLRILDSATKELKKGKE